jgi:DNA-binding MarR family transcriptional regulator
MANNSGRSGGSGPPDQSGPPDRSDRSGKSGRPDPSSRSALSDLAGLDRLVHEPARLAVMALLYVIESADFIFLMNQTGLTWGNLSAHLSRLEEGGYVEIEKSFAGRRPNTTLRLTPAGRLAFAEYARTMKQVVGMI